MGTKDALELDTRRRIYRKISAVPGMYFRELQRALKLEVGEAEYHLSYLEKAGLVSVQLEANRKRYFARGAVNEEERRLLVLLRQEVPRRIVMEILLAGKRSFQELLEKSGKAKSTVSFHLSKFTEAGHLAVERVGKENVYSMREPEKIAKALIAYRATFLDEAVDRFAEAWLELNP
jgi:predicted transcriptional regulator